MSTARVCFVIVGRGQWHLSWECARVEGRHDLATRTRGGQKLKRLRTVDDLDIPRLHLSQPATASSAKHG